MNDKHQLRQLACVSIALGLLIAYFMMLLKLNPDWLSIVADILLIGEAIFEVKHHHGFKSPVYKDLNLWVIVFATISFCTSILGLFIY